MRTFKCGEDLISTLERDPRNDLMEVSIVDADPHHRNLWPMEVNFSRCHGLILEPDR